MLTKLIVSNRKALTRKYGAAGLAKIKKALGELTASDLARGIETRLEWLDASPSLGALKVKKATDPRQNKRAVDSLFIKHGRPDYLLILGAQDVVAHQVLDNLLPIGLGEDEDPDPNVPSDLPYACDHEWSKKPKDFIGPTRVVGRLPDHLRGKNVSFLVGVIESAARGMTATKPPRPFTLTAKDWNLATREVQKAALGKTSKMRVSPAEDSPVPAASLKSSIMHLINCHGGQTDPMFYGDDGNGFQPPSMEAGQLAKRIPRGCVVAAECCYGAELYSSHKQHPGICSTYLAEGAIAFLGSTTVAYGATNENIEENSTIESADILCATFLKKLAAGATTGRALLEARIDFVNRAAKMDPFEFKTLSQFLLLGDPSIRPFAASGSKKAVTGKAKKAKGLHAEVPAAAAPAAMARHRKHRAKLTSEGRKCETWARSRTVEVRSAPKSERVGELRKRASDRGFGPTKVFAYRWTTAGAGNGKASSGRKRGKKKSGAALPPDAILIAISTPDGHGANGATPNGKAGASAAKGRKKAAKAKGADQSRKIVRRRALVSRRVGGKLRIHELASR